MRQTFVPIFFILYCILDFVFHLFYIINKEDYLMKILNWKLICACLKLLHQLKF